MIQTVITHHCPKCGSINIVKNGTDYKGDQKFHCNDCDAYGTLEPHGHYSEDAKPVFDTTICGHNRLMHHKMLRRTCERKSGHVQMLWSNCDEAQDVV